MSSNETLESKHGRRDRLITIWSDDLASKLLVWSAFQAVKRNAHPDGRTETVRAAAIKTQSGGGGGGGGGGSVGPRRATRIQDKEKVLCKHNRMRTYFTES